MAGLERFHERRRIFICAPIVAAYVFVVIGLCNAGGDVLTEGELGACLVRARRVSISAWARVKRGSIGGCGSIEIHERAASKGGDVNGAAIFVQSSVGWRTQVPITVEV